MRDQVGDEREQSGWEALWAGAMGGVPEVPAERRPAEATDPARHYEDLSLGRRLRSGRASFGAVTRPEDQATGQPSAALDDHPLDNHPLDDHPLGDQPDGAGPETAARSGRRKMAGWVKLSLGLLGVALAGGVALTVLNGDGDRGVLPDFSGMFSGVPYLQDLPGFGGDGRDGAPTVTTTGQPGSEVGAISGGRFPLPGLPNWPVTVPPGRAPGGPDEPRGLVPWVPVTSPPPYPTTPTTVGGEPAPTRPPPYPGQTPGQTSPPVTAPPPTTVVEPTTTAPPQTSPPTTAEPPPVSDGSDGLAARPAS
jgi:hypothetical protein